MAPPSSTDSRGSGPDDGPVDSPGDDSRPLHFLLVEDNPGDARLLEEYLSEGVRLSAGVVRAATLGEALDRLRNGSPDPDAVLLDLNLPDADGLETVNRMVDAVPDLPVIVLTGLDDREMALAAVREGAQDYLLKGEVDPELLARSVRYSLERKRAERELQDARRKLRMLDEHVDEVFYLLDFSSDPHSVVFCSTAFEDIWGRPVDDLADDSRSFLDGIHPEDREEVRRRVERDRHTAWEGEYRVVRPDGEVRWVRDRVNPIHDESGDVRWVAGTVWDITARKDLEGKLDEERARLEEVFREAPAFLAVLRGEEHVFEMANPTYRDMVGGRELVGRPVREVFPELEEQEFFDILDEVYRTGEPYHADEEPVDLDLGDGLERRYLSFVYQPLTEEDEVTGILALGIDVTEQVEARQEASSHQRRLAQILDTVADGILFTDAEGDFAYANPAAEEILGLRESEITGRTYRDPRWQICGPEGGPFRDEDLPVARVLESGEAVSEVEHGVQRPDGSRIVLRVNAAPMHNDRGELEGVVASIRDVTEQKRFEAQLEDRALHDHLTDLPNRLLFQDRLEQAIHRAARTGESLAVLFVDLKRFKVINDSMGHDAGDRVLREIGDRLRSSVRAQDTVSRLGGDEFTLLLENIEWRGNASDVVDRIVEVLQEPVELGTNEVTVDASIGVALHDGSEDPEAVDASDLVQRADRAMYGAKQKPGTAWVMAESEDEEAPVTRLERESRLRSALEREELRTVYHGIYDLDTGLVRGVEALARWTDPELGAIPPGSFIPLAEETGLIVELGEQQLRRACTEMFSSGITVPGSGEPIHLNVNLSARQLADPEVVQRIGRVLGETGFPPERLNLEVTESAAMRVPGAVEGLKELGVELAVDDFGTRYSTLAQVQRLTVDELKIDRSFIDGLPEDQKDRAIVETVVTLANALGLRVVAEGIENGEQLAAVRELGCRTAQGFYLAEPRARLEDVPLRLRE